MTAQKLLTEWQDDKIQDVCIILGYFTQYLLVERDGYQVPHTTYINLNMIRYVVEDILNCRMLGLKRGVEWVPPEMRTRIESCLKQHTIRAILNPEPRVLKFLKSDSQKADRDVLYDPDVVEYIYKYISIATDRLLMGVNRSHYESVKSVIDGVRAVVSTTGGSDLKDLYTKAITHIAVALSDWIESPVVGETEFRHAQLILSYDMKYVERGNDNVITGGIRRLVKYNYNLESRDEDVVVGLYNTISTQYKDSPVLYRLNNRIRYFAHCLLRESESKEDEEDEVAISELPRATIETTRYKNVSRDGTQRWYSKKTGLLHSEDGLPAIIYPDGTREWYTHGVKNNEDVD